jgi:sec-independent protein translocase protein TatC
MRKKLDKSEKIQQETEDLKSMSLLEHIDDLRKRLFRIVLGIFVGFVVCLSFSRTIYAFLSKPLEQLLNPDQKLVFMKIQSPFILYMKVALLAGIFLVLPWILYQVWKFISPGLYRREKRMVTPFVFFSSIAFISGAAFGYYVLFPYAFKFLLEIGKEFSPMISVDEYFKLVNRLLLALGVVFELPILIFFLAKLGLITHRFLIKNFHWAVILSVIFGAVLTPPDIFSQIMLAGPLLVLYGLGIIIAWAVTRKRGDLKKE